MSGARPLPGARWGGACPAAGSVLTGERSLRRRGASDLNFRWRTTQVHATDRSAPQPPRPDLGKKYARHCRIPVTQTGISWPPGSRTRPLFGCPTAFIAAM